MTNTPEDIPIRFVSGWNNRDVDELVSIFVEDAEFVNVVGLWWHNKAQIRKAHDYGLRVIFKDSVIKIQKTKVKYLTEEVAVVHVKMMLRNKFTGPEVKIPKIRQNVLSFVVQKLEEEWKCISAHNTDIVPGAETYVIDEGGQIISKSHRKKEP